MAVTGQKITHYAGNSESIIISFTVADSTFDPAPASAILVIGREGEATPLMTFSGLVEGPAPGWKAKFLIAKGATSPLAPLPGQPKTFAFNAYLETALERRLISAGTMTVYPHQR